MNAEKFLVFFCAAQLAVLVVLVVRHWWRTRGTRR